MPLFPSMFACLAFAIWCLLTYFLKHRGGLDYIQTPEGCSWRPLAYGLVCLLASGLLAKTLSLGLLLQLYSWLRAFFTYRWLPYGAYEKQQAIEQIRVFAQSLTLIGLFALIHTLSASKPLKELRFSFSTKDYLLWTFGGFTLAFWLAAIDQLAFNRYLPNLQPPSNKLPFAIWFLNCMVMLPLIEEVLFRKWAMGWMGRSFGPWPAVILSAMAFALAHGTQTHIISLPFIGLGIWFGLCFCHRRSVMQAWLVHASYNLLVWLKWIILPL